ncbi:hypothetical protein G9A89_012394 [Geosiphon pyriformis]|nr:hypothetical protein G9A89_012394 [Geosiphon pyriformis]
MSSLVCVNKNVIDLKKFTGNIENMLGSTLTTANPNYIIDENPNSKEKRQSSTKF